MRALQLQGDESRLFENYGKRLERVVAGQVNAPRAVIEDACANTWLILLRRQPVRETVWPWLKVVAIHEAWRLVERERRSAPLEDVLLDVVGRSDVDERAVFHRELETLHDSITPRQRRLLSLHSAGFSYDEIATITGDSYRTVERQLVRARRRARAGRCR